MAQDTPTAVEKSSDPSAKSSGTALSGEHTGLSDEHTGLSGEHTGPTSGQSTKPSPTRVGEGSAAKGLFRGEVLVPAFFPFPQMRASEVETLTLVLESLDKFMQGRDEEFRTQDREGGQPDAYIENLRELGLFSLIIPEEFGGLGLSNAAYARVLQQTCRHDGSTSLTVGAHSSIGMKGLILFGTPEQKAKYLPDLASGKTIAAFCLTESGAGSDVASMKTSAERQADGTWLLNGEKIWITNGGVADFFTVFARTDPSSGKLSAFVIERGFEGVSSGPKEDKMGIRASITTSVRFHNVKVPAANLLGEEGHGFKIAMAILNNGRTGLGGGCVGAMKRCIELAARQANDRKQFGRAIADYQLIQEKIARMTVACFATESVVRMVSELIDDGSRDFAVEAAISKVFASEALWEVSNEALQIAGGNGFMRDFPYERIVRDSRINMIFEGTNEILRLTIARMGLEAAGEQLKAVGQGMTNILKDPRQSWDTLSAYAGRKLQYFMTLPRGLVVPLPDALKAEASVLQQFTARLGHASEVALRRFGSGIAKEQLTLRRLADSAIELYVGWCVLARVAAICEKRGVDGCDAERRILRLFVQGAKRRISAHIRRLGKNEDRDATALAQSVLVQGGFHWDIF